MKGFVIYALDGDKLKPRTDYTVRKGGNGFGINENEVCYTLSTVDRHMVGICAVSPCSHPLPVPANPKRH